MAYGETWDNTAPDGATFAAADIDAEFQSLKTAISERMDDLIGAGNWANDAVEPKVLVSAPYGASVGGGPLSLIAQKFALSEAVNPGAVYTTTATDVEVPATGNYFVSYYGSVRSVVGGDNRVYLAKGGASIAGVPVAISGTETPSGIVTTPISVIAVISLTAGDLISIMAYALSIFTPGTLMDGYLSIVQLGS